MSRFSGSGIADDNYSIFEKYKPFIRFVIVGMINTCIDFLIFIMLKKLFNINLLICQVAGYSAGVLNSFVMNKCWTFEDSKADLITSIQFLRFAVVNIVSLSVSLTVLKLLSIHTGINVYLLKGIVITITQIINFTGYRIWIF